MSRNISTIRFYGLVLVMEPTFIDNEKMEKVEVTISSGDPKDISFTLIDDVEEIAVPEQGEQKKIKGKMYLDTNKERIIFEGIYNIENKSNSFWLEIDPNGYYFNNESNCDIANKADIMPMCEDYPLSVGTVAFNVAGSSSSSSLARITNGKTEVIAKLNDLSGDVYLHTILSENNKEIQGINTCIGNDNSGFVGELGIFRNKIYIDGEMVEQGITNCYIYAELGESFL